MRRVPASEQSGSWRLAIERAREAEAHGDVPIGAVIARDGEPLAAAGNERELRARPDRPRRDARDPRRRRGARRLAAAGDDALRHARALRDVRRGDRPRPHPRGRLRRARPQGRRRRERPRRARRACAQPPARGSAGGVLEEPSARRCCASSSSPGAEPGRNTLGEPGEVSEWLKERDWKSRGRG